MSAPGAASTVPGLLIARSRGPCADKPAFFWREGEAWRSMSQREASVEIARIAAGLEALGAGPGVRVALLAETRREWGAVDLANLSLGGITVSIYPTLLPGQIAYQLAHAGCTIAVVEDAAQAEKLAQVRDQMPDLTHVIAIDPVDGLTDLGALQDSVDIPGDPIDWLAERAARVKPDDVATYIYTSGTTGPPKGAVLTHANFVTVARATRDAIPIEPGSRSLVFLPMAHSLQRFANYRGLMEADVEAWFGSIPDLPAGLQAARPQVLATVPRMLEKIQSRALAAVEARGGMIKALFDWAFRVGLARVHCLERGAPVPWLLAAQHRVADRLVFSRVRGRMGGAIEQMISGGAALNPAVARWFYACGVLVLEGWGLTETSAPVTANRAEDFRFGTVGKALPGIELKIADDGEILVKSPGVFLGYLKNPEATAEALRGGWFHTGDIGTLDDDGFLRITDRKKEILVTAGGKNIPPVNIENLIQRSAYVEHAVAIGDDRKYIAALLTPDVENLDAWAGQRGLPDEPLADRLARPEVAALFAAAVADANQSLARFEQVKRYEVLDAQFTDTGGALTPTMKLKRRVIAERFDASIEALYT
jgi:long-chain acyl-CoA synthetase